MSTSKGLEIKGSQKKRHAPTSWESRPACTGLLARIAQASMADRDRAKTFWRPEIRSQEPYSSLNCSILSPEIPQSGKNEPPSTHPAGQHLVDVPATF